MNKPSPNDQTPLALVSALAAYLMWGGVGFYFRIITVGYGISPFTLLANRVIWSLAFLVIVLACRRQLGELVAALRTRRLVGALAISSVLIATNWIIFIIAAASGRLLQASLGYFLAPLMSVVLGVVLLGERLRPAQLVAIGLAVIGVVPIVYLKSGSAWIPIGLMLSFSFYGLMRKRIPIGPIVGLGVETSLMLPAALVFVALYPAARPAAIVPAAHGLLIAAGVITAIPLLLFAYAARRLRLVSLGLVQYASPSVQFLVAHFCAGEAVSRLELGAFVLIWLGLIVFAFDSVLAHRGRDRVTAPLNAVAPADVSIALPSRA